MFALLVYFVNKAEPEEIEESATDYSRFSSLMRCSMRAVFHESMANTLVGVVIFTPHLPRTPVFQRLDSSQFSGQSTIANFPVLIGVEYYVVR